MAKVIKPQTQNRPNVFFSFSLTPKKLAIFFFDTQKHPERAERARVAGDTSKDRSWDRSWGMGPVLGPVLGFGTEHRSRNHEERTTKK